MGYYILNLDNSLRAEVGRMTTSLNLKGLTFVSSIYLRFIDKSWTIAFVLS